MQPLAPELQVRYLRVAPDTAQYKRRPLAASKVVPRNSRFVFVAKTGRFYCSMMLKEDPHARNSHVQSRGH